MPPLAPLIQGSYLDHICILSRIISQCRETLRTKSNSSGHVQKGQLYGHGAAFSPRAGWCKLPSGPGWRNGRRYGLKIRWPEGRAGSIPAPGTIFSCQLIIPKWVRPTFCDFRVNLPHQRVFTALPLTGRKQHAPLLHRGFGRLVLPSRKNNPSFFHVGEFAVFMSVIFIIAVSRLHKFKPP